MEHIQIYFRLFLYTVLYHILRCVHVLTMNRKKLNLCMQVAYFIQNFVYVENNVTNNIMQIFGSLKEWFLTSI